MDNEPFGRQRLPVKVTLSGDYADVHAWYLYFKNRAEYKGDVTTGYKGEWVADKYQRHFIIYPQAVND